MTKIRPQENLNMVNTQVPDSLTKEKDKKHQSLVFYYSSNRYFWFEARFIPSESNFGKCISARFAWKLKKSRNTEG
jgi:hypothetical protein